MKSGHACVGMSVLIIVLALAGFFTWTGQSPVAVFVIVAIVFGCCLFPIILSTYQVYRFQSAARVAVDDEAEDSFVLHQRQERHGKPREEAAAGSVDSPNNPTGDEENPNITSDNTGSNKKVSFDTTREQRSLLHSNQQKVTDTAFISVWETVRISEMKPWFCWTTAVLEVCIFFIWPFISLYANKNLPIAIVFMLMGVPSVMRHYFNVSNLLQYLGPIEHLDLSSSELSPALCGLGGKGGSKEWWSSSLGFEQDRRLKNQALVSTIVRRITRSRNTSSWIKLFFFLFFCVFAGFLMASTEESFDYKVKGVKFASSFYYDPQPNLPYPTCSVQKGFTFPGVTSASLADFAFLATMSFAGPDEAQPLLNQWFGDGQVVDDYEYVAQYRKATGTASHPVSYKLFTISALPESAIVAIRGSESMWDWMVDIQLWCGGVLAQIIKAVNPFGWLWEPILDDVVYFINSVQSEELKEVSYYRYTSAFVMDLYAGFGGRKFTSLWTTGASLGGGLSILTGAITGASAVAISGLNAMYSRHTFDPPITAEQLNTRVFNTIPERDIIAHIDEPGMLVQHMQCRGAKVKKPFLGLDVVIVHTIVLMHQLSLSYSTEFCIWLSFYVSFIV
jgi:lipase ATG15